MTKSPSTVVVPLRPGDLTVKGVHPAAEKYSMLPPDELANLAAKIKANGQRFPIIVDRDGILLDGRNRLAACDKAEVEPRIEMFDPVIPEQPDDPDGEKREALRQEAIREFIDDANDARRHNVLGQRAMSKAMLYPKPLSRVETGAVRRSSPGEDLDDIAHRDLSMARTILDFLPDVAPDVRDGWVSLKTAYADALKEKRRRKDVSAKKLRLAAEAPNLAKQVAEETMTLDAAIAELDRQIAQVAADRARHTNYLNVVMGVLQAPESQTPEEWARKLFPYLDAEHFNASQNCEMDAPSIRRSAAMLSALADEFDAANEEGKSP